jgi:diaminopimelate decarboxylase
VIRLSVFDAAGNERTGDLIRQDVAGPCCFAGDILARDREMPRIEAGDYVMVHDTGAYYFTNPFFYNSLPPCAVFGARLDEDGRVEFDSWREQLTAADMARLLG